MCTHVCFYFLQSEEPVDDNLKTDVPIDTEESADGIYPEVDSPANITGVPEEASEKVRIYAEYKINKPNMLMRICHHHH